MIEEITFTMKDGREVKVSEYGGGWTQYNVKRKEMLDPRFLDALWQLVVEWDLVDKY